MPFTYLDREITIQYFEDAPVEVRLRLGDFLEEKLQKAVSHYDEDHTLEEDISNFAAIVGRENAEKLLARAETADRLAVLELLRYTVQTCREETAKKLAAPAGI